ncbi:hypothetical protein SAMN05660662_0105 [Blastococcus aurantiacus]|uniref:Uncharacterized protein n=1 Tax=Blastococcus aurantiacus TaxID=1550231 RepID=A0A1G7R1Y8_9ACTN|nr:hypothetical protein SAMN05660662_0105 [Blastococcus aurantiacus]
MSGYGYPLSNFQADDDMQGLRLARELVGSRRPEVGFGRRGAFAVERQDGERWYLVSAWVPRPRAGGTSVSEPLQSRGSF